jgi:hypothetical protein
MTDGFIITGSDNIDNARLLAVRAALRLEVRGMSRHGRSARAIANEIMETSHRTSKEAYVAYNAWIVERFGPTFDYPLPPE